MRSAVIPLGSRPRQMSADLSAGYCGAFLSVLGGNILYRA